MISADEIRRILHEHRSDLYSKYCVREIGLFGSFARGEQRPRSDVDILVAFEQVPDLLTFIEVETYLGKLLGKKVDLVRKEALRPELKDRILSEVVLI